MRTKRYEFGRNDGVIWSLVFEPGSGQWHIEKLGPCGEKVRIKLAEFETSEHGRQLGEPLAAAVHEAEADA